VPMTDHERLRALAGYEAVLAAPGFTIGHWVAPEPDADGVRQVPWFEYSEAAEMFRSLASANGWVVPFDWMTWAASPAGRRLIGDPGLVADATADDLRKLITAIIRGERFSEGELAGANESGMLEAIVRRAAVLAVAE
jgi:Family of unknown function (DUF6508)